MPGARAVLLSRWKITVRRSPDRLVLEIPSQVPARVLAWLALFLVMWPVGALVLPVELGEWVGYRPLWLVLSVLAVGLWMAPWLHYLLRGDYWLRGRETITIRPGRVEIERGVGRRIRSWVYEGIRSSSWRVSPWRHHVHDWHHPPGAYGLQGPRRCGGALTFTHERRAVRCGRNFGTRKARVVLREIQRFLGEPTTEQPPRTPPKWLRMVGEEPPGSEPPDATSPGDRGGPA